MLHKLGIRVAELFLIVKVEAVNGAVSHRKKRTISYAIDVHAGQ